MNSSAPVAHHKALSPSAGAVRVALVTASDSRTPDTNEGWHLLRQQVVGRHGEPGFLELFRMLSFQEIGPAAMLSRADAGVVGAALVFLLPGSPAAIELAVRRLIAPELTHAVGQLRRLSTHHHHER